MAQPPKQVRVVPNSVLVNTQWVRDEETEEEWWTEFELGTYVPQESDQFYIVQAGDRIDLIAYDLYGDDRLKWLILWVNDIAFPEMALYPGRKLRVPDRRYVFTELLVS